MNDIVVCLATYNGEKFLKDQIKSLLSQTATIDIIIRDDSSSDNTVKIIEEFVRNNSNIKFLVDKKISSCAKENFSIILDYAFKLKKYKYYMFCDQDDIWNENKIEKTLNVMQEMESAYLNKPILVHTDLEVVNENLLMISSSYFDYQGINPMKDSLNALLVQNVITGCTVMINDRLVEISVPLPVNIIMHDWWLALVASYFGEISYINDSTIKYRQHNDNNIGATKFTIMLVFENIFKYFFIDIEKYLKQAKSFLYVYHDQLDSETVKMLESFVNIDDNNYLNRIMILFKYRLFKQSIIKNIGLVLKV